MPKRQVRRRRLSPAKLEEIIEEATVDAYGESEQIVGFLTMLEEHLKFPFKTEMLGVEVTVERLERLDMKDDAQIVAVCTRGKSRQTVPILDLPLPTPPPEGAATGLPRFAAGRTTNDDGAEAHSDRS